MKSINRIFIFFIAIMLLISVGFAVSDKANPTLIFQSAGTTEDKTKEKAVAISSSSAELTGKIKISGGDSTYKVEKPSKTEIKISKLEEYKNLHTNATVTIPLTEIKKIDTDNDGQIGYLRFVDGQLVEKKTVSIASVTSASDTIWNMEFSDVILNGFTGYFSKTGTSQLVSSTFTTSQTYASNKTSAVLLNISAPAYMSPYDRIAAIPNISAWYRLDGGYANRILDSSGNGNTLSSVGSPLFATGKYNNGTKSPSSANYFYAPHNNALNSTTGFVSAWFYTTNNGTTQNIVEKVDNNATTKGYSLDVYQGKIEGRIQPSAAIIGPVVTLNRWHHALLTYDTNSQYLFYDGVYIGTQTHATAPNTNGRIILGGRKLISGSFSFGLVGSLDSCVIGKSNLSAANVLSMYTSGVTQLQAKTNTNATWSQTWNSPSNNPITLPKKSTDGNINSISFKVPVNMTDSYGVTTYYYNQTVGSFTPTTTIMFTEDITKISETSTEPYQNISVVQTMLHNATDGNILLDVVSHIWNGSKTFTTNNSNASMTLNATKYNIKTGYAKKNKSFSYVISMPYYATALSVLNSTPPTGNVTLHNGTNQTFYIQTPYVETIKWYVNGVLKQTTAHSPSSYLWNITPNGQFNITAIATRQDGSISRTWNVSTPFNGSFVNPTAIVAAIVGVGFVGYSFVNTWYRRRRNN